MRTIRAVIFVLVALLVLIVLVVVTIGAFLPQQHISTCAARFQQSPDAIWQAITDYEKFPAWRKDVTRVEALPEVNGKPAWREFDRQGGSIPYPSDGVGAAESVGDADRRSQVAVRRDMDI